MKKLLSIVLATILMLAFSVGALAAEPSGNNAAPLSDSDYLNKSVQAYSAKIGMPVEVIGYAVEQEDNFTVCTMLVKPQSLTRETAYGEYALDCWFYEDEYVGDVFAFADFEWNKSSATVLDYNYQTGNWNSKASFNVTKQTSSDSGALNKAYYKINYTVKYLKISKSRTLEVNCNKDGVIGANGDIRNFK